MTTTVEGKETKRGFWWWLTAILAPIGILGGPIAIAEMFSELIEWHGPINYVVLWWGEHISKPFHGIFVWLAGLVNITLPGWVKWITDYLALGVLLIGNGIRVETIRHGSEPVTWGYVGGLVKDAVLWPYQLRLVIPELLLQMRQGHDYFWMGATDRAHQEFGLDILQGPWALNDIERDRWDKRVEELIPVMARKSREHRNFLLLFLAPFILFLCLWGANFFLAPDVPAR